MSAPDLQPGLPTICRDANRLLLAVEQCVRNFPRYHKYQVGADLRQQAMHIARLTHRAWRDRAQQTHHVGQLVWAVDEIKLSLQLAKTVQAFASFAQFEACATLAVQGQGTHMPITKPCFVEGHHADKLQAWGTAWSSSPNANNTDNAWNVNFNNGNDDWDNKNNANRVRLVRSGEWSDVAPARPLTLHELHHAWQSARRRKKPSHNQMAFESQWLDALLGLQMQVNSGAWWPSPPVCFVTTRPKAREIHAPDFADRVLHHWLVPRLEPLFEPVFVHDSFSNRHNKGTHAAVQRLQQLQRQLDVPQLRATVASYWGQMAHARAHKARRKLCQSFPWLREQFPHATVRVQQGLARVVLPGLKAQQVWVHETGHLEDGLRQRVVVGGRDARSPSKRYSIFARRKPT